MSIPPLERAISLLEQGERIAAQKLLKQLIAADQHNLEAWLWLVETCPTNQQRLHVLEMCLEYNPENEQVQQALEKLRTLSKAELSAILPKYEISEQQLTNWAAAGRGALLAVGVALLLLVILPASGYFFPFVIVAMILVFPFGMLGALVGKFLLRTWNGVWLGTVIMIMLEFWWLSANSAYLVLSD